MNDDTYLIPGQQQNLQIEPNREIWRQGLQVCSYDVDSRKTATAEALCRMFLEAAWNHAERLGIGYAALAKEGLLWVLSRLFFQIETCPQWGEQIELTTWPRGTSGALALRDFEMHGPTGNRLVAGTSGWLVLDATTHRPQRLGKLVASIPVSTVRAVNREPVRLSSATTASPTITVTARYSDIDVNRHVNSARYIGWLLDSYSPEFHSGHVLRTVEINYVGETHWNDTVSVLSQARSPLAFFHALVKSDQSEVCRAELGWVSANAGLQSSPRGACKPF